jgi:uncharacterized membrane protein YeaQ/YmgE (transglycosylase-associated protein family)
MSGQELLIILLVGLIAGWLAGQIVRGTGYGFIADIAIGIVGALIGSWLLPHGHTSRQRHCCGHYLSHNRRVGAADHSSPCLWTWALVR